MQHKNVCNVINSSSSSSNRSVSSFTHLWPENRYSFEETHRFICTHWVIVWMFSFLVVVVEIELSPSRARASVEDFSLLNHKSKWIADLWFSMFQNNFIWLCLALGQWWCGCTAKQKLQNDQHQLDYGNHYELEINSVFAQLIRILQYGIQTYSSKPFRRPHWKSSSKISGAHNINWLA